MFCKKCGLQLDTEAVICVKCGVPTENFIPTSKKESGKGLIPMGYICAVMSVLFIPLLFGFAGIVVGIVNLVKDRVGHGIAQILLSGICALFGTYLGMIYYMTV